MAKIKALKIGKQSPVVIGRRNGNALFLTESKIKAAENYIYATLAYNDNMRQVLKSKIDQIDVTMQPLLRDFKTTENTNRNNRAEIDGKRTGTDNRYMIGEAFLDQLIGLVMFAVTPDITKNFGASTNLENSDEIQEISTLLNRVCKENKYYDEVIKFVANSLLYNVSGLKVEEVRRLLPAGKLVQNPLEGATGDNIKTTAQVRALDIYNSTWDFGIPPERVHLDSQIFASFSVVSRHEIKVMEINEQAFNNKYNSEAFSFEIPKEHDSKIGTKASNNEARTMYFQPHISPYNFNRVIRSKPEQVNNISEVFSHGATGFGENLIRNYKQGASSGLYREVNPGGSRKQIPNGKEMIHGYIWIDEKDIFDHSSPKYDLYEFRLLDGKLVFLSQFTDTDYMPIRLTTLAPKGLEEVSPVEKLLPMQEVLTTFFTSFKEEVYKLTNSLTVYDPDVIDPDKILEAKKNNTNLVPSKPGVSAKQALNGAFRQMNEPNDMASLLGAFDKVYQMVRNITPDINNTQTADLNRATQFQTAAVLIAQDNRLRSIVKKIDENVVSEIRAVLIQYLSKIGLLSDMDLNDDLMDVFTRTLGGLERMVQYNMLQENFNLLIQTQVGQQMDIPAAIDYLNEIGGINTNLASFIQQPQPVPQEQAMAQQGAQPQISEEEMLQQMQQQPLP